MSAARSVLIGVAAFATTVIMIAAQTAHTIAGEEGAMSFQAYLNTIETKTGKTPADLRRMGAARGWTADDTLAAGVKPMAIVADLKRELGIGHGHAMAVVALLKGSKKEGDA